MPLETATYINQLDSANPLGSDPIAAGDDHIRLIKSAVKATFPNITGPVNLTQAQINDGLQEAGGQVPSRQEPRRRVLRTQVQGDRRSLRVPEGPPEARRL